MANTGAPQNPDDDDALIGFASAESLQGRARSLEPESPAAAALLDPSTSDRRNQAAVGGGGEPGPARDRRRLQRGSGGPDPIGGSGLYAAYALILFAVPTLGVSALVGLAAVTGRSGPDGEAARSHFVYQQRTLWAAAIAAVVGLILLAAPFALGVPLLFVLALWTVLRGAAGVWSLKSGRSIRNPRGWWI